MPTRLTAALALGLASLLPPAAALAQGCHDERIKISCAEGSTWDDATRTCAPKPSA
jgi:hypothetical protein